MDKRFMGILAAVVVVLGAIFIVTNHSNKSNDASTSNSNQPTHHVEGKGADGITLLEYGDYECPYCGEYYPIVKQIATLYNQDIYFQFRNLPLTEIHPNAFAGARAAEAASLQGQFWQMHDVLYQNQDQWVPATNPETYFVQYAQQLGLNIATFKTDYASNQVDDSITADMDAFNATGAEEATPTFFLDNTQISPQESVASFEQYINAAILKKTGKPSGISTSSTSSPSSSSTTAPKSTE
jgi:protein-disulfide isomerase